MTTRGLLAWLLALPLMAAGTYVSHCYLAPAAPVPMGGHEHGMHEHTLAAASPLGLAFFCSAPFLLTCVALVALLAGAQLVRGRRPRRGPALAAWPFGILAPLGFLLHEQLERVLAGGAGSLAIAAEPSLALGLLLQVPFGFLTYLLARAILDVARRIGDALAGGPLRTTREPLRVPAPTVVAPPRPALAAGAAGPRGPPLSL